MNSISKKWRLLYCSIAVSALISGCGNTDNSSTGFVKFDDGEPVRSGSVEFRSVADGLRYASRIGTDGSFTLTDRDGDPNCPPGEYEIVVVQIVLTEDLAAEAHQHGRTVPRRYADYYTSGLKTTRRVTDTTPLLVTLAPTDK